MARIKITQTKSRIGSTKNQRANLDALGLHKIGQTVEHDDSKIILGMLTKVKHLVKFETIEGKAAPKKEAAPKTVEAVAKEVIAEVEAAEPKAPAGDKAPKAAKETKSPAKPKKAEGETTAKKPAVKKAPVKKAE